MLAIVKYFFVISLHAYSLAALASDCPIEGTWKSDARKTVASLKSSKMNIPDDVKIDDLFGKQVLKLDCKSLTSIHENTVKKLKFKTVVINGNNVAVTFFEAKYGQNGTNTFTLENDKKCVSINHVETNFKEYYCR
ncbi:MAG: hypothetical protein B7X95_05175 [Methylophilaceae bacterium 17-44-8]|nr:MAG: hypothetical protein B7Y48_10410 [Methylophilales bacterium 28-44-11]OYZ09229.1 MAG: hypothetical protein B7Y32_01715 [Methylophilales bacterium 16-45-7]OZA05801.1 MAG: hypothetical protein B7X95_05175 [Methylophilaceae bacterium 17-44-8]